ncbi:DEAD/DEAH box helicase [Reinekea thalattae]|uniref:DEAD-box ATP-dependent RNA helicase RhpA n=1 Tax=Reinekea thalattae TaxID=2593301 RepID=A0A5C8Z8R7_9GAMM|nr:DEAD/DEAH box helicase [Reinekea thalattae]TXR53669.1 DEAD/DEAH box helicase [Reinekea thalattae]
MNFNTLGLSEAILKAVNEQGYETPTPIQEQAIPAVLEGRDILAAAQTGTGKTAGFTLPMLELLSKQTLPNSKHLRGNQVRALVLTPTRELAAQIQESVDQYGKYLSIRSTVVFGGVKINPQMMKLRGGNDILVATPGRLMDLFQQKAVKFDQLEILVLDEADRMLDMGFIHDIRKILKLLPAKRQNLMFSATFSDDIRTLAKTIVNNPIEISVTPKNAAAQTVVQSVIPCEKTQKTALLIDLVQTRQWHQVLVFSRTKHGANRIVTKLLAKGIPSAAIHGNKSQAARTKALAQFKSGEVQVLVATDIAARGIDIDQLPYVINFDLPNVPEDYVHRIGRTGRAGSEGEAVSFVADDEFSLLADVENFIGKILDRVIFEGYDTARPLPESQLKPLKPKKPKKPKKPRSPQSNGQGSAQANADKPKRPRRPRRSKPKQSKTDS